MSRILIGNVRNPIIDNLTTTESGAGALDARQGKVLDDKKINVSDISNDLITTVANRVLDARQGKALDDKIDELNRKIIDTDYVTSYTLNAQAGTRCLIDAGLSLYSVISLSTGIIVVNYATTTLNTVLYKIDNTKRTVTWTDKNGGNVRLTIIRA